MAAAEEGEDSLRPILLARGLSAPARVLAGVGSVAVDGADEGSEAEADVAAVAVVVGCDVPSPPAAIALGSAVVASRVDGMVAIFHGV